MTQRLLLCLVVPCLLSGCAHTWQYTRVEDTGVKRSSPTAKSCMDCHESEVRSWQNTRHGDPSAMARVPAESLRECGACHNRLDAHLKAPDAVSPDNLSRLDKSRVNSLCGQCHFNPELMGRKAINPDNRHGLFMSVGFRDKKQLISCLDCHQGHGERRDMLSKLQAHVCFDCHKRAMVTMGIFQPFNYVGGGRVCTSCHDAHGASTVEHTARMTAGIAATCVPCHLP